MTHIQELEVFYKNKPELQGQHPALWLAYAQFHVPLNSLQMMVTAVSSQQENLPRKRSMELSMRNSNFNLDLDIQQLQYYHSSTYPMQTAFDMLTISNLQ